MRVGVFTPLLSQLSAEDVFKKLKGYNIDTVELGTGNYPGDAHCKLSMLENKSELKDFKSLLVDNGITISALSCHGNPLHPDKDQGEDTIRKSARRPSGWPRSSASRWWWISAAARAIRPPPSIPTG